MYEIQNMKFGVRRSVINTKSLNLSNCLFPHLSKYDHSPVVHLPHFQRLQCYASYKMLYELESNIQTLFVFII